MSDKPFKDEPCGWTPGNDYSKLFYPDGDEPDSGEDCPGCGVRICLNNVGGYRTFCERCVDAMPPFPTDGGGYVIEGQYPNFRWRRVDDAETLATRRIQCDN